MTPADSLTSTGLGTPTLGQQPDPSAPPVTTHASDMRPVHHASVPDAHALSSFELMGPELWAGRLTKVPESTFVGSSDLMMLTVTLASSMWEAAAGTEAGATEAASTAAGCAI